MILSFLKYYISFIWQNIAELEKRIVQSERFLGIEALKPGLKSKHRMWVLG